ncbi:Mitochondrial import inner membrane translocase subunit TIM14-1 [Bienertia sinuspersici]
MCLDSRVVMLMHAFKSANGFRHANKCYQATPLFAGLAVAAAALAGRYGIQAWHSFKARPPKPRRFYEGGFQSKMTRREVALILGVR